MLLTLFQAGQLHSPWLGRAPSGRRARSFDRLRPLAAVRVFVDTGGPWWPWWPSASLPATQPNPPLQAEQSHIT